ncbi:cytochrome P450 52A6 [Scheffersomyces xylosifermentans]|uniref:cytochrome P450 52A6 n=1 Tax=Scheffersomyces xylosifermentans TaxID=1304137 RepID=UPI00315D2353
MSIAYLYSLLPQWYYLTIAAVGSLFLIRYIQVQLIIRKHGCKNPPKFEGGFLCIPIIRLLLKLKDTGEMVDYGLELFKKYPSHTQYVNLFGVNVLLTCDPELMKAILATQFNDFALGFRHAHFAPLLGEGIFTLDGEGWKHSRSMLRPQFAREQVSHVKALEPHLLVLADHIKAKKGETFDLQELFFRLTLDSATEFLFGESVHSLLDEEVGVTPVSIDGTSTFAESFNTSQRYLASRSYSQILYWTINNSEFKRCNANVRKVAKYFVNKALNLTPQELEEKSKSGYIFLYELVKQTRNPTVLQDQLLNILVAGRDTTAGLLSFTFYELARRPEILQKLKDEVYANFGGPGEERIEDITFESLKRCEYLKVVLNEVLRLYPSVPINFRCATKDTVLPTGGGMDGQAPIFVPRGTTVAYGVYFTHRLEEHYGKDANEFRPERWFDMKRLGWAYLPFNGGPRICLGQQFAITEASYIIVRLLQMFPNLVSKDQGIYPPRKAVQLTMCHQEGVHVQMTS